MEETYSLCYAINGKKRKIQAFTEHHKLAFTNLKSERHLQCTCLICHTVHTFPMCSFWKWQIMNYTAFMMPSGLS